MKYTGRVVRIGGLVAVLGLQVAAVDVLLGHDRGATASAARREGGMLPPRPAPEVAAPTMVPIPIVVESPAAEPPAVAPPSVAEPVPPADDAAVIDEGPEDDGSLPADDADEASEPVVAQDPADLDDAVEEEPAPPSLPPTVAPSAVAMGGDPIDDMNPDRGNRISTMNPDRGNRISTMDPDRGNRISTMNPDRGNRISSM